MADSEHASAAVDTESNSLSSTSDNKAQSASGVTDTSTDHGNEEEMPVSRKHNSYSKIAPLDSQRDSTKTVEYQKLIKAIQGGDVFKINEIADKDLFAETTPNGNTVLHIAVRYRNWLVVDRILSCEDEIYKENHKERDDQNELFIYKKNNKRETPLHIAAKYGNVLVVCILLYHEGENRVREKGLLRMKDKEGNTPLHNAVRHGHELIAEILIETDDSSVLEVNKSKQSPLSIAIDGRLNYIARFIIENHPVSLNHKGHEELTLLHSAVMRQDYDMVVDILKKRGDLIEEVDEEKIWTPLHYAAASGHVKIARYLAKENAALLYKRDINGQTPLHLAAKNDRPGVLKMLLKDYPDSIEMIDDSYRNILHVAAQNGKIKIVSFILRLPEMEDLVNSRDKDGNTPLHLAAKGFQSDVVYIFSNYMNVNIMAINEKNETALEIVQRTTPKGKEIQKHLTTKALKAAYANRGLYEEDIQRDHRRAHPERSKSAPEKVLKGVAHPQRAVEAESMPVEQTRFAGVEDIDGEGGCRGKEMAQTLSVMNTLIATFTFTAAFTLPGGLRSDGPNEGMAILIRRTSFKAFVITDTISMTSSMTAAVIVFWSFWCSKSESFMDSLPWAIGLTWIGLISMTLAFVTGLYVVLSENMALAITVSTIGCVLPLFFYVFAPIISLLSGQSAQVNPFAFSFKMVKIFLKKPIRWCFRCFSTGTRLIRRKRTHPLAALIHKIIFGLIYYLTKALVIALSRWIKELVSRWINALAIKLCHLCSSRGKSFLPK